ncbi:MAG: type II toxin-antitoxin system VapC family toxin [Deltaproteobacteria bacterium]|nr:type II toxin-antitoxin system VapC family toxin [Deltaproteobacteria bacterium]
MVIDTSAIMAILRKEADALRYTHAIVGDPVRLVSAATVFEAFMVATSRAGEAGGADLDELLNVFEVEIVPVTTDHLQAARSGFSKYGKGRHPARLNFGDCFAYALAVISGEPLLFKGADFGKTDLQAVVLPPADEP